MENFTMKPAEDKDNLSIAQQEEAVQENVEQPVEEVKEETYQTPTNDDGDFVVNFDQPIETEDAVQERETETVDVGEQTSDGESMDGEVREQPEQEEVQPTTDAGEEFVIESVIDEPQEEEVIEQPVQEQVQEPIQENTPQIELPEDVQKLVDFMNETGGTLEDYTRLNKDISKMNPTDVIREYYKSTKPHFDQEDINFDMDSKFYFDPETDDERTIKAKKLAFKEELYKAQNYLNGQKEKYYADLKTNPRNIDPQVQEALDFYNQDKQAKELQTKQTETFHKLTDEVFNDFKGFDFKVGDNKFRVKVGDVEGTKNAQKSLDNFINQYVDENGNVKNVADYHKALYAARNVDKLAAHFYEQGRADALKASAAEAKNIDMKPRQDAASVVTSSGNKFRVVSGNNSNGLKIKMRK